MLLNEITYISRKEVDPEEVQALADKIVEDFNKMYERLQREPLNNDSYSAWLAIIKGSATLIKSKLYSLSKYFNSIDYPEMSWHLDQLVNDFNILIDMAENGKYNRERYYPRIMEKMEDMHRIYNTWFVRVKFKEINNVDKWR